MGVANFNDEGNPGCQENRIAKDISVTKDIYIARYCHCYGSFAVVTHEDPKSVAVRQPRDLWRHQPLLSCDVYAIKCEET